MSDQEEQLSGSGEGEEGEGDDSPQDEQGEEEGEQEQEAEEEEEKVKENPLTEEAIAECISLLCKTGDGLAHAYVRLDIHDRELSSIDILQSYIHLRYMDISRNNIKDISPLSSLTHLLTLKADFNRLVYVTLEELPYLQVANFSNNRLKATLGLNHPLLEQINLNFNQLTSVTGLEPERLGRLHTIELRGNKLTSTEGFNLPNLKNLFLAQNLIKKLDGLEKLSGLTSLHLRDNQIESLDGISEKLQALQYVNCRGNNITDNKEIRKLACLPRIRAVVFSENPVAEEDDYRIETLVSLRKLERLDKDEYSEEEHSEANDIFESRRVEALAAIGQEVIEDGEQTQAEQS